MCQLARRNGLRNMRNFRKYSFIMAVTLASCSSSDPPHSSAPTCPDVCAHLANLCGSVVTPGCDSQCPAFRTDQRTCITSSAECRGAQTCLLAQPDAGDSRPDSGSASTT